MRICLRRREFIAGLGGAAAWPVVVPAQQSALPVIGFLHWATRQPETGPILTGFRQGLAAIGYSEKRNVAIDFRWANGDVALLPALVTDLVQRRVSVMVVVGSRNGVFDAKKATSEIPIVFAYGGDPVRDGIITSLNHPGNNITGITGFNSELNGKRISLLLSLVPQAKRIAFLKAVGPPRQQQPPEPQEEQFVALARTVGCEVIILAARGDDYEAAFQPLIENPVDAMIIGNFTFPNRRKIMPLVVRYKIPAIYPQGDDAIAGGLMGYGSAVTDVFRVVGNYTGRILKGEKPADLPVQQPTKFELVINLKAAKALNLTIPPGVFAIADEVIE